MGFEPVSMISVSRCEYKDGLHIQNHRHNFYHLLYLTGGEGAMRVGGEEFSGLENDMYIIPPQVDHDFISNSSNPLCTIEAKFIVNDSNLLEIVKQLPHRVHNPNDGARLQLDALLQEARQKPPFYKEIITAMFVQFLLHMLRISASGTVNRAVVQHVDFTPFPFSQGNSDDDLCEILEYIHKHYDQKITLSDLAKRFALNHAHLCRIFSQKYGIPPIQYLNRQRLHKAKELLTRSSLNITEISERVGFRSVHYLSRYFTDKEGMSPLKYRQGQSGSLHFTVEEKFKVVGGLLVENL